MKNQNKDYAFILNPHAGIGKPKKEWPVIQRILKEKKMGGKVVFTKSHNQAVTLAKKYSDDGYKNIIAIGGDGTLNEIINGIFQSSKKDKVNIGLIPLGSGNDFANGIGLSSDIEENIERIRIGQTVKYDVGNIEDLYFINSLGIGFDALVSANANKIKKLKGLPKYLWAVIKTLKSLKPYSVDIKIRNYSISRNILLISIGNSNLTRGGFKLSPNAKPNDQLFDITIIDSLSKYKVLTLLPKAISGKHLSNKAVTTIQSDHIEITSDTPLPVYMDGEIPELENPKNITVKVIPSAINFLF
ncbi:MAG: diacylglycerol kinase family protein, partial [Candidatus Cloacimonadota bacterium]|nr:diacylglycerol kinase family protein [Candidatus Cloacimonadota bacterium]